MKLKFKVSKKNAKFFYIFLATSLVITSYFVFKNFNKSNGALVNKPAVAVDVIKLKKQIVNNFEELPARTVAYKFAEIKPQVDGIILRQYFVEGSKVKKGQQLYQIDPAPYLATYNIAKADLKKAEANLATIQIKSERFKKLVEIDAISKQEYDDINANFEEARAQVNIAKATLDKAKVYLDYTKVFAPISGRIDKSILTEGSLVYSGQSQILTTITQLDPIYIDIERASEDLLEFKKSILNQKKTLVEVYLNDGTIYSKKGTLKFAGVNVDKSTSAIEMRAIFENSDQTLLPGSFVKVRIKTDSINSILVPQKATVRNPDGSLSVWVVDDKNKVKPLPIKVLRAIGNQWLVNDGLKEGDIIVVEGLQKISPEALVETVFPKKKLTEEQGQINQKKQNIK